MTASHHRAFEGERPTVVHRLGKTSVYMSVGVLAVASVLTRTQCWDKAADPRALATCTTYVTQPGDTPYRLAERFYERGYQEYKIREANPGKLTKEGFFKPGTTILVPPDDRGRPIDVTRPDEQPY
jgi:hypothetical protein